MTKAAADTAVWQDAVSRAREYAPYLAESLTLYPDCAAQLQALGPARYLQSLSENLPEKIGPLSDEMALLRQYKRHAHLAIAVSDIAKIWDWVQVTEALTQIADTGMARLLCAVVREQGVDGPLDNPLPGLFVLAVGKYGARELNYSSDIDFCVFYDADVITLPNMARAERTLIKIVQNLIAGFERITPDGYIFRADLRLRPDPRSNSVAVSTLTAERYYETLGQNWERAAMIKARICGGDRDVGQAFIKDVLTPFIWRRSLDYAAIEDIHSIKRQVHNAKSGHDIKAAGHHLKLGYGGIREIEFYAQTQQLILGGREPRLRTMRTVDALAALTAFKAVDQQDCDALTQHYAVLRKFEHAAQMINDAQTHIAPEDDDARRALAALAGYGSLADFDTDLVRILRDVHARYVALFPGSEALSLPEGSLSFTGVEPGPATLQTLSALGFENGARVWHDMAAWLGGRIAATRTERARELLTRLAPRLIKICSDHGDADTAFAAFAQFFTGLNGGVGLLSMFVQEPARLSDIIALMTNSPYLSDRIGDNPALLDAMIDPRFLQINLAEIGTHYKAALAGIDDFETAMNAARRLVHEDQFRVNASALSHHLSLADSRRALSRIADHSVAAMLPVAAKEAERISGALAGDYAVLALGKAGGQELSLSSDLDVMMVYAPHDRDDPAALRAFTKLTQRFVSALSAVTAEGRLYEIDMALRPSGRSGPVAVSVDAFLRYYQEKAWTWEFMALTRARVIAASTEPFAAQLDSLVGTALAAKRDDLDKPRDVADMLHRLRREKPARAAWDIKQCVGGLRDCEFIAQKLCIMTPDAHNRPPQSTLAMIDNAAARGRINADDAETVTAAVTFFHDLTQAFTLTVGTIAFDPNTAYLSTIANLMDTDVETLTQWRDQHVAAITAVVNRVILNAA